MSEQERPREDELAADQRDDVYTPEQTVQSDEENRREGTGANNQGAVPKPDQR